MEKFLFLDLDDTVFQTARKCASLDQATPASYNLAGEPSSYFSPKQQAVLQLLAEQWRIIPTTARTQASYARVDLGVPCVDGAILNHGATILCTDGAEDHQWRAQIAEPLVPLSNILTEIKQVIEQYAQTQSIALLVRITTESNLDYYLEVRHLHANHTELHQLLHAYIRPLLLEYTDFQVYLNGNSLTILPRCVNKAHAVEYRIKALKQDYGEIVTMGMGDSLSDAPFMALCDYVMTPKHTQLHNRLV
ncbi:MAG: HAD family hydrolase [Methyloprofundus sp.]|nr:HAD family hydrolase [Methyloprofundus sp.]